MAYWLSHTELKHNNSDSAMGIQAMEMRCYRKIPLISYKDNVTNEEVRAKI